MKPTIGKRAGLYQQREEKPLSITRQFVEINTHQNIAMKRQFMFIEDAQTAININTLEERLKLTRWLLKQLQSGVRIDSLTQQLSKLEEKQRHTLQKRFRIFR